MFSSLVLSVCKIVLVAGCIYAGVGSLVLLFTRQNKPVGPVRKNAIKSESEEPPPRAAVGYKSFMNEIQHASSLSKKEYKALRLCTFKTPTSSAVMSEQGVNDCPRAQSRLGPSLWAFSTRNGLRAKMDQSSDLHGEIRKHIKNHVTESEIKVIKQLIRKNYAEKHQYTTEQFTDEFLQGELYSLVKKPHHIRKKYEQAYFSKIQKIVKQKTLLQ